MSTARNRGIEEAKGEYISFVDSDDFLAADGIEKLVSLVGNNHNDIILGHFARYHTIGYKTIDNIPIKRNKIFNMNTSEKTIFFMLNGSNPPYAKLFRREFIVENNLKFPVGLRIAEDLVFTAKAFFLADRITLTDDVVYNYRQDFDNNHSAIGKVDENKALDFYKALREIREFLINKDFLSNREVDSAFKDTVMQHSLFNLQISEKDPEVHKLIFNKIHKDIFTEFDIAKADIKKDQQILGYIYDGDYEGHLIYRLNEMKNYALNKVDAVGWLEGKLEQSYESIDALNGKIKYQESIRYFIKYPFIKIKRVLGRVIRKTQILLKK